jgi:alginate O-acetyltransferase complex protein AlgI
MLFNSITYAVFLPIVFVIYWFVLKHHLKLQNLFLLIAGYIFYGWWDWRFLFLLMLSSTVDYIVGLSLGKTDVERKRKLILMLSISFNIGLLGFFKYFNFFVDSFSALLSALGFQVNPRSLNVILPVGISFYTFQSLSYTIDVYKRKMNPTKNALAFYTFVSFFPQLVAGPIERAIRLLPQFEKERTFDLDLAKDGIKQILWGLFKKIVIADTCASQVGYIFNNYNNLSSLTLLVGAIYFAFQIYCDFSGYSDIAIGSAKLFGFRLMRNFANPYFSRNIAEFWRRWHISLSTWFRDYVYIPLGGNRGSKFNQIKNSIITFTVSGFWHGANWTFVIWGFLNGLYYVPGILFGNIKKNKKKTEEIVAYGKHLPSLPEFLGILLTFFLTLIAWVFFRSPTLASSIAYLKGMFQFNFHLSELGLYKYIFSILILIIIEWIKREDEHPLKLKTSPVFVRWSVYYVLMMVIFLNFKEEVTFIYFQF